MAWRTFTGLLPWAQRMKDGNPAQAGGAHNCGYLHSGTFQVSWARAAIAANEDHSRPNQLSWRPTALRSLSSIERTSPCANFDEPIGLAPRDQAGASGIFRRYAMKPNPARPINISVQLGGSGASETGEAEIDPMESRLELRKSTKA